MIIPMRVREEQERIGLDLSQHGESVDEQVAVAASDEPHESTSSRLASVN
jgi:hypothetical protein